MEFVTSAGMKKLERRSAEEGVSYDRMMEEAGREAARIILERFPVAGCRVVVLCGRGNNGGDGFVTARELAGAGGEVTVVLWKGAPATETARQAFGTLPPNVKVLDCGTPEQEAGVLAELEKDPPHLTIDALYGAGFRGAPSSRDEGLFACCAWGRETTVALDLPSGVEADTGRYEACLPCALCIAMGYPKPAHLVPWRGDYMDKLETAKFSLTDNREGCVLTTVGPWDLPARRLPWGHKGTNGRLGLVCGSRRFPGAAQLSAMGALRSGAGYVHLISTGSVCQLAAGRLPEVLYTPCRENSRGSLPAWELDRVLEALKGCDGAVVGCGLTACDDTAALVRGILERADLPLVLDADALNVLAGEPELLKRTRCPVLVTPHPGEFSRLFGAHMDETGKDVCAAAGAAARQYSITVLLKGPLTAIAAPDGSVWGSFRGNSGLARGGSGDVLAGILGSMTVRGLALPQAARAGTWLHGRAAELAAAEWGVESMQPSDVAGSLGKAFLESAGQ